MSTFTTLEDLRPGVTFTDAGNPVLSTAEAKRHLREDLSDTNNDSDIDAIVEAATFQCEMHTNRKFITRTVTMTLTGFPNGRVLPLPFGQLQSVTSINYEDVDSADKLWAASNYQVNTAVEPGLIVLAPDIDWPDTEDEREAAVTIVYDCGYGDAATDVPANAVQAVKVLTHHFYNHRDAVMDGVTVTEMPLLYQSLIGGLILPGVY